jgi:hypothetical protein
MKKLLIAMLALGSLSSFAQNAENDCTYYVATETGVLRIVEIMNSKGYVEVSNENDAKYRIAAYKHDTYSDEGFVAGIEVVDNEQKPKKPYFFEHKNYSHWFGASLTPGLKKLRRTLPSCN